MKMGTRNFNFTFLGLNREVIRLSFRDGTISQDLMTELAEFFSAELAKGQLKWVLDFSNIPFPSTLLIAFVISATFEARIRGGDVKIIHAKDSTRNNFVTFSSLSYLVFDENPMDALRDFEVDGTVVETRKKISSDQPPPPASPAIDTQDKVEEPQKKKAQTASPPKKQKEPAQEKVEEIPIQTEPKPEPVEVKPNTQDVLKAVNNKPQKYYFKTESIASNLYKICDFIVEHSRKAGMDEKQIVKSKIAVYEACLNVIEHAYHSRPDNWIEVWVEYTDKVFKIVIQDNGLSYEKRKPKEYDVEAAVEKRQTGGFGLHIIERSMDEVNYEADETRGNQLILTKYLE